MSKAFDTVNQKTLLKTLETILQSWAKYLEQNREIQSSWTGKEKFDIYFCVFFHCYCQMSPPKFEIFLIFPYFLRSYVLSRSATREATHIPSLLYWISRFVLLLVNRICI